MADLHRLGDFFAQVPKVLRPFFGLAVGAIDHLQLLGVCFGVLLAVGCLAGAVLAYRLEPTGQRTAE